MVKKDKGKKAIEKLKKKKNIGGWQVSVKKKGEKSSEQSSLQLED